VKRKFYLYDLVRIPELCSGDGRKETTGPGHCDIFFDHDGKTWRIQEKESFEGEDELWQCLCIDTGCFNKPGFPDPANSKSLPGEGYAWEAVEVKLVEVLVKQYVPVED
jgi:hypothetical protein